MAWRIHENVIRGEIDNRQRHHVRGKIWLKGLAKPVELDLEGNASPDLAGCLLTFANPGEPVSLPRDAHFSLKQTGTIGDLTASRKVRVFDIPLEEALERMDKKLPVPEHLANCLYLEWFSEANGRVVIESVDYKLTISPPAWRLTPDEENQRQSEAARGFAGFMQKLGEAIQKQQKGQKSPEEPWDEFDYEKFMRENDARTDKYSELLDKYIDHPDRDKIIAKEMGWAWLEEAIEKKDTEKENEEGEEDNDLGEIPDLEPDPTTEGVDWVRDKHGHIYHPLSLRALEASVALWKKYEELGLEETDDPDLCELIEEHQTTAAKLAGALDSLGYGRSVNEGSFIVAYLKRALNHLHATQAALKKVEARKLLPAEMVGEVRSELFTMREEILRLMEEFRKG